MLSAIGSLDWLSSHVEGLPYDLIMLSLLRELALVKVWTLGLISKHCNTVFAHFYYFLPCCFYIFRLQIPISTIHIPLVSPSLRRTSAPIQFTIVLGVLGTQETLCYLVAGLFERDHLHPTPPTYWQTLGHPLEGNLLLSYKTLRLEAQHESTRTSCVVDISAGRRGGGVGHVAPYLDRAGRGRPTWGEWERDS